MEIGIALRNIIIDDADITALVSTRVYPSTLPQDPTLPALTVGEISFPMESLIDLAYPRYQLTVWADSDASRDAVGRAILYCLQRWKGTQDGIRIEQITFLNKMKLNDPETGRLTMPMDWQINYREE